MRRWAPSVAAVAALAIGGALQAEGKSSTGTAARFKVHVTATSGKLVDNPPAGTVGAGDVLMSTESATRDGVKVGRTVWACTIVANSLNAQCSFTLRLPNGDIQYGGFGKAKGTETFAVLGGTGSYSRARGEVVAKATDPGGQQHDLTFHLK
jgi:allene oxide cyclase